LARALEKTASRSRIMRHSNLLEMRSKLMVTVKESSSSSSLDACYSSFTSSSSIVSSPRAISEARSDMLTAAELGSSTKKMRAGDCEALAKCMQCTESNKL